MALSRVKNWNSRDILTASDQNAEFNNIINNPLSLISPLTGTLDIDNQRLDDIHLGTVSDPSINFNGDANTGFYSSGADAFDITTGGEQVLHLGTQAIIDVIEDSRTNSIDIAGILELMCQPVNSRHRLCQRVRLETLFL